LRKSGTAWFIQRSQSHGSEEEGEEEGREEEEVILFFRAYQNQALIKVLDFALDEPRFIQRFSFGAPGSGPVTRGGVRAYAGPGERWWQARSASRRSANA
jgi:hypothetical protein